MFTCPLSRTPLGPHCGSIACSSRREGSHPGSPFPAPPSHRDDSSPLAPHPRLLTAAGDLAVPHSPGAGIRTSRGRSPGNDDQCQDEGLPSAPYADQTRPDESAGRRSVTWTKKGRFAKPSARSRAGEGWFIARNFKLIGKSRQNPIKFMPKTVF